MNTYKNTFKPYLINAFYTWAMDINFTPLIEVSNSSINKIPANLKDKENIIFNIHPGSIRNLIFGKDCIEFEAKFGGEAHNLSIYHKTIKKITEDIERFSFNTSVSNFMICVNELGDLKCNKRAILEPLLICLSPYAPHITEELYAKLKFGAETELKYLPKDYKGISFAKFPEFNEAYLVEDSFTYPISFNGKMRFNMELPATLTIPEIEKEVMSHEDVQKYLEGKTPKKIIIVPKKIVNFVV